MNYGRLSGLGLFFALIAAGCGEEKPQEKKVTQEKTAKEKSGEPKTAEGKGAPTERKRATVDHEHGNGPNGGAVFDLGKFHAEFTVDHAKKECKILLLGFDEKTPRPGAAKELTLTTKPTKSESGKEVGSMTITLKPTDVKEGKATTFVGSHPDLANVASFEGTVAGEIDGKPSSGDFKE